MAEKTPQGPPDVSGLPESLHRILLATSSRRALLRQSIEAGVGMVLASPLVRVGLIAIGAALETACGNTRTAYDETQPGISVSDFEKGVDMLPTPAARSMVVLEAGEGNNTYYGHAVIAYAEDGSLKLYTAYHVIAQTEEALKHPHWRIRVGSVGTIPLDGINFAAKPDSGVDTNNLAYGLMQADLAPFMATGLLQEAIQQGTVLPAVLASDPNHDITTNKGLLGMYMADGNPDHNYLTILSPSSFISDSGLYRCLIMQGGYCLGMSGSPAFKGVLVSNDYQLVTDEEGRYIVEGVTVLFAPNTTDPSEAYRYTCSNDNVTIAATKIAK